MGTEPLPEDLLQAFAGTAARAVRENTAQVHGLTRALLCAVGTSYEIPSLALALDASGAGVVRSNPIPAGHAFYLTRLTVANVQGTYTPANLWTGGYLTIHKNAVGWDTMVGFAPAGAGVGWIPAIFADELLRAVPFLGNEKLVLNVNGGPVSNDLVFRAIGRLAPLP